MRVYFIRHGQSENNALWQRTGSSRGRSEDAGLTGLGRRQAEIVARFLRDADPAEFGITHLYTSLMVRAIATGTIIAEALGLPLVAWPDLHETGGIYWEDEQTEVRTGLAGKDRAYFEREYPRLVLPDTLGAAGWWNRPFEEREERPIRARRVWRELRTRHGQPDDRVVVIAHGGFYNYLLAALLDMPTVDGHWFVLHNAAITRLDFQTDGVGLVYLNRADFLPPELIT